MQGQKIICLHEHTRDTSTHTHNQLHPILSAIKPLSNSTLRLLARTWLLRVNSKVSVNRAEMNTYQGVDN